MVAVPTTGLIATLKAPVELNPGTVTVAGTVAMEVLLLLRETVAPPGGVIAVKKSVAERRAAGTGTGPDDWCYVFNFQEPDKPNAIRLSAGVKATLKFWVVAQDQQKK